MISEQASLKRRNTLIIFATFPRYDDYSRASAISQHYYPHDYQFYSDTVQQRNLRNQKEVKKILSLMKEGLMTPTMLEFNVSNCFYPSYVVHHHFVYFYRLVSELSNEFQKNLQIQKLALDGSSGERLGSLFHEVINVKFSKPEYPKIINNQIHMRENDYFYSFTTSLHIHVCSFIIKQQDLTFIVFVQLRDQQGNFCKGVEVKDLGSTISPDYLHVGYRFNGVQPLTVVKVPQLKIFRRLKNEQKLKQFALSLQDLSRALHITVKYTQMRKQFATKQKDKSERAIIEYQAVHSRIIDAFTTLYTLSMSYQKMINIPMIGAFFAPFTPIQHKIIFEKIVTLRQCCGGFGYLQVSGFPAATERVGLRASQSHPAQIPQIPQIMKRIHYYSSSQQMDKIVENNLKNAKLNSFQPLFYVFVSLCLNIRRHKEQFSSSQYLKHMIMQSCMQSMHTTMSLVPNDPKNPSEDFLYYLLINYLMNNAKYINWNVIKQGKEELFTNLTQIKAQLLQKISKNIPMLTDILEISYVRNVIVGSQKEQQFYEEVMKSSRESRRNSQEYKKMVQKPFVDLMSQQRPKL